MRSILLPLLLLWPLAGLAEVYRWIDTQGKVHYTQTKPPQADYKAVAPAPPPGALGGGPNLGGYVQKLENERQDREKVQAETQRVAQQRQQKCSSARRQQQMLTQYEGRIGSVDEQGNRDYWTPERHAAEREQARANIAANCDD